MSLIIEKTKNVMTMHVFSLMTPIKPIIWNSNVVAITATQNTIREKNDEAIIISNLFEFKFQINFVLSKKLLNNAPL